MTSTLSLSNQAVSWRRGASLAGFCLATALLIPLEWYPVGAPIWLATLVLVLSDEDAAFRRRLGVLLGCVALLAWAPINTDTSTPHVLQLGAAFLAVVLVPAVILGRTDPGVIRYRFWPSRFRWVDIFYVAISIPLAWGILRFYFEVNPFMPQQWSLPAGAVDEGEVTRLFFGINGVGIWDELFFVNTVFAVLRSVFPYRWANAAQAVVYTSVLFDMAFIGIGPIVVYLFAWTQGAMFEESETLLYVLIVHLIVDAFLFAEILSGHYPGYSWILH